MTKNNFIRSLLENSNIKVNEDIIAQVVETADIYFVDSEVIEPLISFDDARGFTFRDEPIASIEKLESSDDLYPSPNKVIPPCATTEDYNYYILTTTSETNISSITDITINGLSQIRNDYLVKNRKIEGYRVNAIGISSTKVEVFLDDFSTYDNHKGDEASVIVLSILTEDAATDFTASIEKTKSTLLQELTTRLGSLGELSMGYIDNILASASDVLIQQVDNFNNNMDSEIMISD